jgi:hypothetical protein
VRTAARLRLVLVSVVVASGDPVIYLQFLLILGFFVLMLMIINGLVEFSQKKLVGVTNLLNNLIRKLLVSLHVQRTFITNKSK